HTHTHSLTHSHTHPTLMWLFAANSLIRTKAVECPPLFLLDFTMTHTHTHTHSHTHTHTHTHTHSSLLRWFWVSSVSCRSTYGTSSLWPEMGTAACGER